ncbi:serine proteinase [Flagelloscypha sp. PMI_526]|nr:serine proteinase [Flagelloscypha sp. PMI_526]
MHFSALYAVILLVVGTVVALAPPKVPLKSSTGTSGRYIVSLKPDVNRDTVKSHHGIVTTAQHDWDIINAFVIEGNNKTALDALLNDPRVETVEEDGIARADSVITQGDAPWGLRRISTNTVVSGSATALSYSWMYANDYAGRGVDVYVVDSGIRTTHREFGGRARWGATFGPYASADGNGHGTHIAGTIGGTQFGVAKLASLIAVKVLADDTLFGLWSDIISGINWVVGQAQASGRPSVINMSISGSANSAVDNAVDAAANHGVHVVVSAGNDNADACGFSPVRAIWPVTVGASTISDTRASFSNFGSCVRFYAPGQTITSSWFTSDTATNILSGTSMATPHVAGMIAYIISKSGSMSVAAMWDQLWNQTQLGVMPDNPSPNALAHRNFL